MKCFFPVANFSAFFFPKVRSKKTKQNKTKQNKTNKQNKTKVLSSFCNFSTFHFQFSTFPFAIFLVFFSIFIPFLFFLASFLPVGQQNFASQKSRGGGHSATLQWVKVFSVLRVYPNPITMLCFVRYFKTLLGFMLFLFCFVFVGNHCATIILLFVQTEVFHCQCHLLLPKS